MLSPFIHELFRSIISPNSQPKYLCAVHNRINPRSATVLFPHLYTLFLFLFTCGASSTSEKFTHQVSEGKVSPPTPMESQRRIGRRLLEVFSVQFPEFGKCHENMYGCILILSDVSYVVFDRIKIGTPLNIDEEGFVRLRGPKRVIRATDYVRFTPHLFTYDGRNFQFICNGKQYVQEDLTMWNTHTRNYNSFLTRRVQSPYGPIVVNYAIYNDGAEAWVSVKVVTCQFPAPKIYGIITAQNSKLPHKDAKSVLFSKKRDESIYLDVATTDLPLSRSKTAHPYNSDVTIILGIWQCGNTEAEDQPITSEPDMFFPFSREEQFETRKNDVFSIDVSVTWHEEPELISGAPSVV